MNYFRCTVGGSGKGNTVTVTCAEEFAGLTITLSKTGKTYTKTCPSTSPYVVIFNGVENGTYTVSCTLEGETYSETVIVQDISCVLNYGFTWRLWVDTASQLDSSDYDSLDEVIADEKALRELFLEHACVDYMAELTSSNENLETVINNDLCAKWINLSDYALDNLYANEVIADLMDEADKYGYGEWALMPQVPTMTSNTAPYGEAISSTPTTSAYDAYHAFNGVDTLSDMYASNTYSTDDNAYVGYSFVNPIIVKNIKFKVKFVNGGGTETFIIEGSNDKSEWIAVTSEKQLTVTAKDTLYDVIMTSSNGTAYEHYRVRRVAFTGNNERLWLNALQFYAWAPKGNVPVMTSNTAPYGEVFAGGTADSVPKYYAFDGNETSQVAYTGTPTTVGYHFVNPVCLKRFYFFGRTHKSSSLPDNHTCILQASNDGSTWTDLKTIYVPFKNPTNYLPVFVDEKVSNDDYYLYYRLNFSPTLYNQNVWAIYIDTIQFYGRELKVSVPAMTSNTAPFGEASATTESSGHYTWHAFDKSTSTEWNSTALTNQRIAYDFGNKIVPKFATVKAHYYNSVSRLKTFTVQGSNTGSSDDWNDLTEQMTYPNSDTQVYVPLDTTETYRYIALFCKDEYATGTAYIAIKELNFYGLDYSEKEFEVGTTKKWLYDHGVELETATSYVSSSSQIANKENNKLKMAVVSATNNMAGFEYEQIDFTPYSLYRAKVGDELVFNGSLAVRSTQLDNTQSSNISAQLIEASNGNLPNNYAVNVESISASYYPVILTANTSNANARKITVTELWLE